jgi:hypothetical protein
LEKNQHKFEFIPLIKERKIHSYKFPEQFEQINESLNIDSFAKNSAIDIGEGFRISVQAGYGNYCEPRKTFKDMSSYSSFEILIMYEGRCAVVINELMQLSDYEVDISGEEFEEYERHGMPYGVYIIEEGDGCPISGYVPGETVDLIIKDLKSAVVKLRSRNVLFEKIRTKQHFFRII